MDFFCNYVQILHFGSLGSWLSGRWICSRFLLTGRFLLPLSPRLLLGTSDHTKGFVGPLVVCLALYTKKMCLIKVDYFFPLCQQPRHTAPLFQCPILCILQMAYAARDVQVSVALFLHLLDLLPEAGPAFTSGSSYGELSARCQGLVDVPFRGRVDGVDEDDDKRKRSRKQQQPPPLAGSPDSGDQQVPDPRRNSRRKPLGVGYSARWGRQTVSSFLHCI